MANHHSELSLRDKEAHEDQRQGMHVSHPRVQTAEGWKRKQIKKRLESKESTKR